MNLDQVFRCNICTNVIHNPVTLPCGDSICKYHVDKLLENSETDITYKCAKCMREFHIPECGFEINFAMDFLLKRQLEKLDFGDTYKEAIKECERLRSMVKEYESNKNGPELALCEHYSELRTRVEILKEDFKEKLEDLSYKMADKLATSESACKEYLRVNQDNFAEFIIQTEKKLKLWNEELEMFKIDEEKWKEIKEEAIEQQKKIKLFVNKLNNEILSDTFCKYNENDMNERFIDDLSKELLVFHILLIRIYNDYQICLFFKKERGKCISV
jgi:hypothetical protein